MVLRGHWHVYRVFDILKITLKQTRLNFYLSSQGSEAITHLQIDPLIVIFAHCIFQIKDDTGFWFK